MKKYRVLLVVRHPVGGIRTFFKYFYRNFDINKYCFTLVAPELPETKLLLEDLSDLQLTYLPISYKIDNKKFLIMVTKIILSNRFDLIHSHGFSAGISSVLGSLLRWKPHILTCHDTFNEKQFIGIRGFVKKMLLGLVLSLIDCMHFVSYDARNNMLEYLKILKVKKNSLAVIPSGIETKHFLIAKKRDIRKEIKVSEDDFLIGFLGRFMSPKGFIYLVDAIEHIIKIKIIQKRPIVLCFSQEDGFIREEKENIKNRGLTESILFLPFVADVASTLKGLDLVVMPSLSEACGLLAMETMVAGVPLIGTNCVGLREVLEGTPATIVPVKDSLTLSIALLEEMKNPSIIKAKEFAITAAARFEVRERAIELEILMMKYLSTCTKSQTGMT